MKKYVKVMKSLMEEYYNQLEIALELDNLNSYYYVREIYNDKGETEDLNYINRLRIATALLYLSDFEDEKIEKFVDELYLQELRHKEESTFSKEDVLGILDTIKTNYKNKAEYKFFEKMKDVDPNLKVRGGKRFCEKNIENLLIEECIEMALNLREYKTASKLIDEWITEQKEWNIDNLGRLYYFERDRKNHNKQLEAEEKIIDIVKKSSDNEEISQRLNKYVKDLINFQYYDKASEVLKETMPYLEKSDINWYSTIFGQTVLENYMDLILKDPENKDRKELWNLAEPYLMKTENFMSIILKKKMEEAKKSIA